MLPLTYINHLRKTLLTNPTKQLTDEEKDYLQEQKTLAEETITLADHAHDLNEINKQQLPPTQRQEKIYELYKTRLDYKPLSLEDANNPNK